MLPILLTALLAFLAIIIGRTVQGFIVNLRAARASGFKYVIVPVYLFNRLWLITFSIWLPLLQKLPHSWTHPWITFIHPEWTWLHQHEPFKELGTDVFIAVSPEKNVLWVADPAVINQITTRRNDFPKPVKIYASVNVYGKNVVSTEGQEWRHHRKITAPPFGEKNNNLVWSETIRQTEDMLRTWVGPEGKGGFTVDRIADDTMRLSLHIISQAGFGVPMKWPTNAAAGMGESHEDGSKIGNSDASEGHTMSYTYALHILLESIIGVMLLPGWFSRRFPSKTLQRGHQAYIEFGQYMEEMLIDKKKQLAEGSDIGDMDLLAALVKNPAGGPDNTGVKATEPTNGLTDEEVLGNAFVFILAGHETTANAIHFALLYLAMYGDAQKQLQREIESIFGSRTPDQWDYATDLPKMLGGMLGAVMNEELRLAAPILSIPKCTFTPQTLDFEGRKVTVPADSYISLTTPAIHRNPKAWPHSPNPNPGNPAHPTGCPDNDLNDFVPSRWLINKGEAAAANGNGYRTTIAPSADTDDLGINTGSDTSTSLFTPPKGAYVPFSEGYRSCLGRRFAQVEIIVALAMIFREHSVELAVDKWASDEEVANMNEAGRRAVWEKARERTRWMFNYGSGQIITLQFRKGHIPVRFVKKGEERFNF